MSNVPYSCYFWHWIIEATSEIEPPRIPPFAVSNTSLVTLKTTSNPITYS